MRTDSTRDSYNHLLKPAALNLRIVSTTCSNTEIVSSIGCEHFLVGVDDYSDFPESTVANLPRVGPDLGIRVEDVLALKPDLVLASDTVPGHDKVIDSLKQAGLNVFAPRTIGLDDVYRDITDIANLLNVPDTGVQLISEMQHAMPARDLPRRPELMVQWWPKPIIGAAHDSWVEDIIELAGGRNSLHSVKQRSTPLEDNDSQLADADAWIISWCGVKLEKYRPQVLYERSTLQHCNAISNRRVFPVSEEFLGRPSPRLVEGYRQLAAIVDQLQ